MAKQLRADAPIFLIGFMASGKTTVGRLLAARLGWQFEDLDQIISATAGRSVAEIFANEGEAEFRRREREALRLMCDAKRTVVATGGGAACQEQSLALMLASGGVVALSVEPAEVLRRAGTDSGRPLLATGAADAVDGGRGAPGGKLGDPITAAAALLAARQNFYARAHHRVATDGKSPEAVAEEVLRLIDAGAS